MNETGITALEKAVRMTLGEIASLLPKLLFAVLTISIFVIIGILLNRIVKKILQMANIDELIKSLVKELPISISHLIVIALNLGLTLLAIYTVFIIALPEYVPLISSIVDYVGKVLSVAFLVITTFIVLNAIVEKVRMESKLRGFMMLLSFFLALALVIDLTTISREVKLALTWGVSIGLGILIGAFAIWFFFGDKLASKTN